MSFPAKQSAGTIEPRRVFPPSTWKNPREHLAALLTHPWYRHLFHLQDEVAFATEEFYRSRGIRSMFVPVTTGSISSPSGPGSDSLPVSALLDGEKFYLADSMQFLLELGTRLSAAGAYYLSCSFRGERVDDRHLAQFWHSEVEIRGGLENLLTFAGAHVDHLLRHIYQHAAQDLKIVAGTPAHVESALSYGGRFPRIRFSEAFAMFGSDGSSFREVVPEGWAITPSGERRVLAAIGECVWLTHLPQLTSPFYQQPETGTPYCLSADLLMGKGETLGAGERCRDKTTLLRSLRAHHIDEKDYAWYIEMKEQAPLQTAGFGLGIERFLQWLTKAEDIRDCTLWIRGSGNHTAP